METLVFGAIGAGLGIVLGLMIGWIVLLGHPARPGEKTRRFAGEKDSSDLPRW